MSDEHRFEQTALERERVDKEAGILYGVRVMGLKSAHGYEYALAAQKAAAPRYEQMAVGLDHDYEGKPLTIGDTWGVLFNPRVDDKGTLADLRYLKSHVRTEQVLEDVERGIGLFSLSAVTTKCVEQPKGIVSSFEPIRCDLVVRGATTKRLFEQAGAPVAEVESLKTELAVLKTELAAVRDAQARMEQARTTLAERVEQTTKGIDLSKFFNV